MIRIHKQISVYATMALVGVATSQSAQAVSLYSLTDLGFLTDNSYSYASGINDLGQVIVDAGFDDGRSFVYNDGQLTEISPLPGDDVLGVSGINNVGQVVGNSVDLNVLDNNVFIYSDGVTRGLNIVGIPYAINDLGQVVGGTTGGGVFPELAFPFGAAFLYDDGTTSILNTDLSQNYVAYGMNNLGEVVGIFGSPSRAFLFDDGTITNLGTLPGDNYSSAEDINDLGQVVGVSALNGVNDGIAFLYSSGMGMISLGRLSATDTYSLALDINNKGQVVGWSGSNPDFFSNSGVGIRAFLYSDGMMHDLNDLIINDSDFVVTQAQGINEQGQIAGAGVINGELRAVLLTPQLSQDVSEPSLMLGILALGVLGVSSLLKSSLEEI